MWFGIITLFPEMFCALDHGIPGRAQKQGLLKLDFWNPRDFTHDKHHTVDDRPYGGGPGMVMKVEPLQKAILTAKNAAKPKTKLVYLSPQGRRFDQTTVEQWLQQKTIILLAGRYEGIDERILQTFVDEECSLGDFVMSGGELPAMCMIDAVARQIPGALGDAQSAQQDSFMDGLLDHPHYTRPEEILNLRVPEVLLSGNHATITRWRLQQALGRTWLKRPDLLKKRRLNAEEEVLLAEFIRHYAGENHE